MSSLLEYYSIQRKLQQLELSLAEVEREIAELKEALKWARELHPKSLYRTFGKRVIIEVDASNAEEIIKGEIEKLEKVKEVLEKERKQLLEKLRRLESPQ
jgi:chaperonin cofactor prefoldin